MDNNRIKSHNKVKEPLRDLMDTVKRNTYIESTQESEYTQGGSEDFLGYKGMCLPDDSETVEDIAPPCFDLYCDTQEDDEYFEDYMERRFKEKGTYLSSDEEDEDPPCLDTQEDVLEKEPLCNDTDGTCSSSESEDDEDYMERKFKEKGTYLSSEVIATDEDGIETTFEDIKHASRSLGISIENITKCCKNIRGYEYITVNDKKYTLSRI